MNTVILSGNLTRDPVYKQTEKSSVLRFSIACNKQVGDKEIAEYVNVTVFGGLADTAVKQLKKGTGILILGEYNTRSYEANGEKKYATTVIAREIGLKLFPPARVNAAAWNKFGFNAAESRSYEEGTL